MSIPSDRASGAEWTPAASTMLSASRNPSLVSMPLNRRARVPALERDTERRLHPRLPSSVARASQNRRASPISSSGKCSAPRCPCNRFERGSRSTVAALSTPNGTPWRPASAGPFRSANARGFRNSWQCHTARGRNRFGLRLQLSQCSHRVLREAQFLRVFTLIAQAPTRAEAIHQRSDPRAAPDGAAERRITRPMSSEGARHTGAFHGADILGVAATVCAAGARGRMVRGVHDRHADTARSR